MRKFLTVGLFAVGLAFAAGMLDPGLRAEFAHSVSYQLDHVVDGLDRVGRIADRLGRAIDRIASRVLGRDDAEVARTVRTRVSEAAERVRSATDEVRVREERRRDEVRVERRQEQERFTWTGRVGAGEAVEIKGVNGAVSATASDGDEIEVVAIKDGRRSDPAEVVVEVVEHAGGVTVCAVYPSSRGRANECVPGSAGGMNVRNNDVEVEFRVRVPDDVRFVARTVNGDVDATGLDAHVSAATVNGSIEIGTNGAAEATTVNGSIEARLGAQGWDDALEFSTVNGSITVDLPEGVDAEVDASWVSGGITSDLPLTVQGSFGSRRARGVLGDGGPLLELSTVNGEIRLRGAGT